MHFLQQPKKTASTLFSDSGVESGTTGQGDQESPSLELAIQRLAETIKEFDTHGHSREEDEDEPGSTELKTGKTRHALGVEMDRAQGSWASRLYE